MNENLITYILASYFLVGVIISIIVPIFFRRIESLLDDLLKHTRSTTYEYIQRFYFFILVRGFKVTFFIFIFIYFFYSPALDILEDDSRERVKIVEEDGEFYVGDRKVFTMLSDSEMEELVENGEKVEFAKRTRWIVIPK